MPRLVKDRDSAPDPQEDGFPEDSVDAKKDIDYRSGFNVLSERALRNSWLRLPGVFSAGAIGAD